jgi:hypothetical protein
MKTSPRTLIPPHRRPEDGPPPPADLYVEPDEDVLLLGEMLHDLDVMYEMLRKLAFDRDHYRANLRIVLGASVRMNQRCQRLLGELQPKPATEPAAAPEPFAPEPSNKIDDPPPVEPPLEPSNGRPPKKTGREYTLIESHIMSTIEEHGALGTTDLIQAVGKKTKAAPGDINEALAALRRDKKVITSHVGRGIQNRLAS